MNVPVLRSAVLVIAMLCNGPVGGAPVRDGHWLLRTCTEDKMSCLGFLAATRSLLRESGSLRCVSAHARLWELRKAYLAYAGENPHRLDAPAVTVAERAFSEGPACREISVIDKDP